MYPISLCILLHNQVKEVRNVISTFKTVFPEVEVVIGDNSNCVEKVLDVHSLCDEYVRISDSFLWEQGFGPAKQKIIEKASNNWVVIADPDEQWFLSSKNIDELFEKHWESKFTCVFSTSMLSDGVKYESHGRVFNREHYRLLGIIHEEPFHKKTRAHWSQYSPVTNFASISHGPNDQSFAYIQRKLDLYDNLVYRFYENPSISIGTNSWWRTNYMPLRLKEGFEPCTFAEWHEKHKNV